MTVKLIHIEFNQKQLLAGMMQNYLGELRTFAETQEDDNGIFDLGPYFDLYWQEAGRHPFFIFHDGALSGFALVREYDSLAFEMAEFFILPEHRRLKIGARAATTLFRRFKGNWRVAQHDGNTPAQVFWRKVIGQFTNEKFLECRSTQQPLGPLQMFTSAGN